jgi:hypothetical protein
VPARGEVRRWLIIEAEDPPRWGRLRKTKAGLER